MTYKNMQSARDDMRRARDDMRRARGDIKMVRYKRSRFNLLSA